MFSTTSLQEGARSQDGICASVLTPHVQRLGALQDDYFEPFDQVGATDMNDTPNADRTNCFQNVPAFALDTALWIESDRMCWMKGWICRGRMNSAAEWPVRALDVGAVTQAANLYIHPASLIGVIVGDWSRIEKDVHELDPGAIEIVDLDAGAEQLDVEYSL